MTEKQIEALLEMVAVFVAFHALLTRNGWAAELVAKEAATYGEALIAELKRRDEQAK